MIRWLSISVNLNDEYDNSLMRCKPFRFVPFILKFNFLKFLRLWDCPAIATAISVRPSILLHSPHKPFDPYHVGITWLLESKEN